MSVSKNKDKKVSVLLAIFLGLFTWIYTYKKDNWKFWLNLVLSLLTIGLWYFVAWVWAIIDVLVKHPEFYVNYQDNLNKQTNKSNSTKRWYTSNIFIVILLIVFFPLGLFMMWKYSKWSKKIKWIVTLVMSFLLFIAFAGTYFSAPIIFVDETSENTIRTDNAEYELKGSVSSMRSATLTINNKSVELVDSQYFIYKTTLDEGENQFVLVAKNSNGEVAENITIVRTPASVIAAQIAAQEEAKRQEEERQKLAEQQRVELEEAKLQALHAQKAIDEAKAQNNSFYVNNAYYKGGDSYDVVVYSPSKDELKIYVNDDNPVSAKVNEQGWATFQGVNINGLAKLSFAKKDGWFNYTPVNYVTYISVDKQEPIFMDESAYKAAIKAEQERKAREAAKAQKNSFYVNNAYYKGDDKYDVVVYSLRRDTLKIYVNDDNPVSAKVNDEGWATFEGVNITEPSKLSFARKDGWFSYTAVNYVTYISVDNQKPVFMQASVFEAILKALEAQEANKLTIDDIYTLKSAAKNAVLLLLKSPGSAEFPGDGFWDDPLQGWSYAIANDFKNGHYLSSYVDSQNGFGAKLRSNFQVGFRVENDVYRVVFVNLNGKIYLDNR